MPVTASETRGIAQEYSDNAYPGEVAEEVNQFYEYYTAHITRNGAIYGLLSVNSYTGEVPYHSWHRLFVQSQ